MLRPGAVEDAVGDGLEPFRHRDLEGVGRLVARVVVDRIPGRGDVRLADDERPVVRVDEACSLDRLGDAAVADDDRELPVLADAVLRRDRELLAVAAPRRATPVDLDAVHGEAEQVEVEARQALRRLGADLRGSLEHVGRRVVLHVEVVVADVVASVPVQREVRIAGPRSARLELPAAASPLRRRRAQEQDQRRWTPSTAGHRGPAATVRSRVFESYFPCSAAPRLGTGSPRVPMPVPVVTTGSDSTPTVPRLQSAAKRLLLIARRTRVSRA